MAADRVDLVDENDTRRGFLALLEHVADTACADADKHFHEIGAADGKEGNVGFAGDRTRKQSFAGARRADHQYALRNSAAELLKFFRVAQKLDQLLDFVLGFLDAGDVLECDFVFVTREHARFRFAEIERAFAGHPDLLAEKKIEQREEEQNRPEAQERLAERMRFGTNGRLNSSGGEFVLQIAGEIEINNGAERHFHVLHAASALLDVFAAQLLGGLAFLDEQGERRIFVVNDLLVLEQFEEAIVGNVLELRIIPAPEEHRQGKKAESGPEGHLLKMTSDATLSCRFATSSACQGED